jgi:hypothetical protein
MDRSESITELAKALAKAQKEIKPASKDSVNPHYKTRYADLASVWEACRGPLTDNGLSVLQLPVDTQPNYCTLMTMLLHESGEYISSTFSVKMGQETAQGYGSALTYLRRYGLAAMVGVVADDDDDGQQAAQPHRAARQQPQSKANGKHESSISRHQKLIERIHTLRSEAAESMALDWMPNDDEIATMSEDDLVELGRSLKQYMTDHRQDDTVAA